MCMSPDACAEYNVHHDVAYGRSGSVGLKERRADCGTHPTTIRSGHLSRIRSARAKRFSPSPRNRFFFAQGDTTEAVFYIQTGKVKVTVVSEHGKEAVVAILDRGAFLGESCLVGQTVRTATATTMEDSRILRIEKAVMLHMLQEQPKLAETFMTYLLMHSIRVQEDLVDQLFNSSEKRLARALLLLAHFGKESRSRTVLAE